jgi:hypothetical protein
MVLRVEVFVFLKVFVEIRDERFGDVGYSSESSAVKVL